MKKNTSVMLVSLFLYSVSGLHAAEQHTNTALGSVSGSQSSSSSMGMDGLLNRISEYTESRGFLFAKKPRTVAEYVKRVNVETAVGIQKIAQENPVQNQFRYAAMLAQIDETIAAKRGGSGTKPQKQLQMQDLVNRVSEYAKEQSFDFDPTSQTVNGYAQTVDLEAALGIQKIVHDHSMQDPDFFSGMNVAMDEIVAKKKEEKRRLNKKQKVSDRSDASDSEKTETDDSSSDAGDDERTESDSEYDAPVRGKRKRASQSSGKKSASKFICDSCSKGFSRATNLKRHQDTVHKKIKPYACSKQGLELVAALNDIAPDLKKLKKINFCGVEKSFSLKHHLVSHLRSHLSKQGIYKYRCECGNYEGNDLSNLHRHRKTDKCSAAS